MLLLGRQQCARPSGINPGLARKPETARVQTVHTAFTIIAKKISPFNRIEWSLWMPDFSAATFGPELPDVEPERAGVGANETSADRATESNPWKRGGKTISRGQGLSCRVVMGWT